VVPHAATAGPAASVRLHPPGMHHPGGVSGANAVLEASGPTRLAIGDHLVSERHAPPRVDLR
jgi:hypothetical protein